LILQLVHLFKLKVRKLGLTAWLVCVLPPMHCGALSAVIVAIATLLSDFVDVKTAAFSRYAGSVIDHWLSPAAAPASLDLVASGAASLALLDPRPYRPDDSGEKV
jgi:hypothetical protein